MKLVYIDDLPVELHHLSECTACSHDAKEKPNFNCGEPCIAEAKRKGFKNPSSYYYVDPLMLITLRLTT